MVDMNNKPIYLSIFNRMLGIFFVLVFTYGIILGIVQNNNSILYYSIFIFGLIGFSLLSIALFVSYIINDEKIIIKTPFLKKKECLIEDIIGYSFLIADHETTFTIYTENKEYSIMVSGKKITEAVNNFTNKYYSKIIGKNQEKLLEKGILIKKNKRTQIHFYNDYLEYISKENIDRYYYRDLIIKIINNVFIHIFTKDNKKIKLNIYHCRGQYGLIEHLRKYQNDY